MPPLLMKVFLCRLRKRQAVPMKDRAYIVVCSAFDCNLGWEGCKTTKQTACVRCYITHLISLKPAYRVVLTVAPCTTIIYLYCADEKESYQYVTRHISINIIDWCHLDSVRGLLWLVSLMFIVYIIIFRYDCLMLLRQSTGVNV